MSDDRPVARPCSQCGQKLQPFLMGTGINADYTTKRYWAFAHHCPKKLAAYDKRLTDINNSGMSDEQKYNARYAAGFMNAIGS